MVSERRFALVVVRYCGEQALLLGIFASVNRRSARVHECFASRLIGALRSFQSVGERVARWHYTESVTVRAMPGPSSKGSAQLFVACH